MKKMMNLLIALVVIAFSASAQNYTVDTNKSILKWNGKKVTGEHYGKINLKEGAFEVKNNQLTAGKFVINMTTITCDDLEGEWNDKLVGHLKSDDFFGVEKHPEAVLVIKESAKIVNGKAKVKGHLTIKGITHPVEFDATQKGNNFTALITVDRSKYDVRYGSGKFFDNLGDATIYDEFTLEVNLTATSETAQK
jgi:polyisoprenoid-binding protein YceI